MTPQCRSGMDQAAIKQVPCTNLRKTRAGREGGMAGRVGTLCPWAAVETAMQAAPKVLCKARCILTGKPGFSFNQLRYIQNVVAVRLRATRKGRVGSRPKPAHRHILLQLPLTLLPVHGHCKQLSAPEL